MTQHEDPESTVCIAGTSQPDQLDGATQRPVEERVSDIAGCSSRQPTGVKAQVATHGRGSGHRQVLCLNLLVGGLTLARIN